MEWAGQYDQFTSKSRWRRSLPLVTCFLTFGSKYLVFPLALIRGILALVLTGTHFSISAAVGVISTLGVAILGGVLLISRIKDYRLAACP